MKDAENALSEVERAKLVIAVDRLKKEKSDAEVELESLRDQNLYAAGIYGSELCAGGMIAEENKIAQKIYDIGRQIDLLEKVLRAEVAIDDEEGLRRKLKEIEQRIADSNAEKAKAEKALEELKFVRSILERP